MFCRLIRSEFQCTIVEACDGLEAVGIVAEAMVSRNSFDVIFMDSVMPVMDGPTATATIRAAGYISPIFGVTGNALDREVADFIASGADTVFTKPVATVLMFKSITLLRQNRIIDESSF